MVFAVAPALARRPDLWASALRSTKSLVADRWWSRRPFLPVPDRDWLEFRLATAYGGDGHGRGFGGLRAEDLITWLEWRKTFPS